MYVGHRRSVDRTRAVARICAEHPAGPVRDGFVIPTLTSIPAVVEIARRPGSLGPQDPHWADAGPGTGEVGGAGLAELGCTVTEVRARRTAVPVRGG